MESMMIYMPIVMAVLGLVYMWTKQSWVMKQDAGDAKRTSTTNRSNAHKQFNTNLLQINLHVCKQHSRLRESPNQT